MSGTDHDAASPLRRRALFGAGTLVLFGLVFSLTRQTEYLGFYWDDAYYLAMGEFFNPASDRGLLLRLFFAERGYPALFPLVLGLTGGALDQIARAYTVQAILITASLVLCYLWLKTVSSRPVALALTLAFALSGSMLALMNLLFAEHLFTALGLAVLLAMGRHESHGDAAMGAMGLAALSMATRSIGIAFLAGTALWLLYRDRHRAFKPIAVGALTIGVFAVLKKVMALPGYLGVMIREFPPLNGVPWPTFLVDQVQAMVHGLGTDLFGHGEATAVLAWIATALALAGWLIRLRQQRFDAVVVLFYLPPVLLWPFPEHAGRVLHPLLPVVLWYLTVSLDWVAAKIFGNWQSEWRQVGVAGLLALVVAGPTVVRLADRLTTDLPPELEALRHTPEWLNTPDRDTAMEILQSRRAWLDDAAWIGQQIPVNQCVVTELPAVVFPHSGRLATLPPWLSLDDAMAATAWPCRYYYYVPLMLEGGEEWSKTEAFIERFEVLRRTQSPRDPDGPEILGVLLTPKSP